MLASGNACGALGNGGAAPSADGSSSGSLEALAADWMKSHSALRLAPYKWIWSLSSSMARLQEDKTKPASYGALSDHDTSAARVLKPAPERVSLWSSLLFTYASPVIAVGNERQLDASDVWENTSSNDVARVHDEFQRAYADANGALFMAIRGAYGARVVLCGLGALVQLASTLFSPVVLHHVVDAFSQPRVDVDDLAVWLAAFFALRIASAIIAGQVGFHLYQLMIRLAVSVRTMLFQKALRRANKKVEPLADSPPATADVANLFTADLNNVVYTAHEINNVWIIPLQIVGTMVLLFNELGVASLAGLGIVIVSIIVGGFIAALTGAAYGQLMQRKDTRMQLVKEVFRAIQVVKLQGWDARFTDRILALRERELETVWRRLWLSAVNGFVLWASPALVSITSFAVYTLVQEQRLTAAKVFTSMALFAGLRIPLVSLPGVLAQCFQAKISLDRIQEFLHADEVDTSTVSRDGSAHPDDVAIEIRNGSFGWTADTALLRDVNVIAHKGDFVVVHGPVGAGKSSLCLALLGEMEKLAGDVFVRGRVAYYAQQTWIQNLSIRDNILFGRPYDETLYRRVIEACGLVPDLAQFAAGDHTEIGANGVNLSGGQKARLCLARACYADADVVILDSPLAAVDAVVQAEIFSKCLCTLLEAKTVVLVTHAPDVIASDAVDCSLEVVEGHVSSTRRNRTKPRHACASPVDGVVGNSVEHSFLETTSSNESRLVDDEKREEGRVSKAIFMQYFNALGGVRATVTLVVILSAWQASQIASDLWLSHWTGQKDGEYDEAATQSNLLVYVGLCGLAALFILARSMTTAVLAIRAARYLFEAMTRGLLRAPLQFFDATPIGRILNRYGDDVDAVDFMLPMGLMGVLSMSVYITAQLGTAVATVKWLGVLVLPLVYVYLKTTAYYVGPSRDVARLVKVSDSPLLSFVTSAEGGAVTLRAFGATYIDDASQHAMQLINANSRVQLAQNVLAEWFELRIQLVGCGILVVIVSALVYLHETLSPGLVGLAFMYALNIQLQLLQVVGIWSYLETIMISPERILEYAAIRPEGDAKLLLIEPSPQWPQRGTIEFDNVVFSYKDGASPVLKGLSFSIKNNEKIGIVGRTGAGKSSLTMALFRINELVDGCVKIDGVDISTMPLKSLRSHLSIIPQSPVLFKGTLRAYMDPFDDYSDEEVWSAFEKVEMKDQITALEGQLLYELSENGENFSVGERQMLCMARAMLTKARIVVMDEATASIDHATEKKLQHMINRDFQEATVLTIAHRLATVLDSDRIMVLSDGRVVEFDTPSNLVKNEGGMFYELAKEGGVLEKLVKDHA